MLVLGGVRWWVRVDDDVRFLTKNLIPLGYQSEWIGDLLIRLHMFCNGYQGP